MDLAQLKRIAIKGEGQILEFKKKANYPEKIVKEVVAFANSKGGRLLLGVDDDGTVSGTRNIEGEAFVVEKAIKELIKPRIDFQIELLKINDKRGVAVFNIPEGNEKPYRASENIDQEIGTAYIRCGDESVKTSKEMRQILKRRNDTRDERFNYGEKEKKLMQILEEDKFTNVSTFAEKANIPKFVASKTLVKLVLANLLTIEPSAQGDKYFVKETT
ncbi:helix-turn-helix domain-containing protein [Roseivirga sp.]|uniref:AlbA family DNA-binding domain-containing protein n=1 Tax=Roseivirga sp. TaxID=1964215 RepID=UPI003B8C7F22